MGGMLKQGWNNLTGQNNAPIPAGGNNQGMQAGMTAQDIAALNPDQVKSYQNQMMAGGYDLPQYGADSQWGPETQGAYDKWSADQPPAPVNSTTQSVDQQANNVVQDATDASTTYTDQHGAQSSYDPADVSLGDEGLEAAGDLKATAANAVVPGAGELVKLQNKKASIVGDAFKNMDFGTLILNKKGKKWV